MIGNTESCADSNFSVWRKCRDFPSRLAYRKAALAVKYKSF